MIDALVRARWTPLVVAIVLFAGVTALCFAADTDAADGVTVLYTLPIALLRWL